MSGCIPHLASLHSPVFLLNSCLDLFSAPGRSQDPFSRSYGVSLPSSLATTLSTPQYVLPDYLCRSAVRVPARLCPADFLGSMVTCALGSLRGGCRTIGLRLCARICLRTSAPLPVNAPSVGARQCHCSVSTVARAASHGILTVSAIGFAFRLSLRTRLTPG